MKESIRQATKAQANAVRSYLQELGVTLTHTQALEVLARGQGLRSRQVLAHQLDQAAPASTAKPGSMRTDNPPAHYTVVSYRYVDGGNCKRASQTVFRGRLTVDQLKFIQWKLDDGMYFVPAQIGFECLTFGFPEFGEHDHGWHVLELGDSESWEVDSEGFVLKAGSVAQTFEKNAGLFATDADCDNLFRRFAQLDEWDPDTQQGLLVARSFSLAADDIDRENEPAADSIANRWLLVPELARCPHAHLTALYEQLRELGFDVRADVPNLCEWTRDMGPNAYQFVILQGCDPEFGAITLNCDVSTLDGWYLTESPALAYGVTASPDAELQKLDALLEAQKNRALSHPRAWSDDYR